MGISERFVILSEPGTLDIYPRSGGSDVEALIVRSNSMGYPVWHKRVSKEGAVDEYTIMGTSGLFRDEQIQDAVEFIGDRFTPKLPIRFIKLA